MDLFNKAYSKVFDEPYLEKAKLVPTVFDKDEKEIKDKGDAIEVMFNPESYSITTTVGYGEKFSYGNDIPKIQFSELLPQVLQVKLFFDTYSSIDTGFAGETKKKTGSNLLRDQGRKDVRLYTDQIMELTKIDSETKEPPLVRFEWGSCDFVGVITKIEQQFLMFTSSGRPVRAELNITMKEFTPLDGSEPETTITPEGAGDQGESSRTNGRLI